MSPKPVAASRTRRDWSALNTPRSQNTSANRARPCAAMPGSCSSMSERTYASVPSGRARNSGGTAWAPSQVGTTSIGPSSPEPVGDLDEPQLRLEVEAVAGLRLDRRDAVGQHLVEPAPAVGEQLALRRGARGRDRRQDPAAGREDVEVRRAALAQDELVLARAGEQQVGVRIDEAGRDRRRRRRRCGRTGRADSPSASRPASTAARGPTATIRPSQQATTGAVRARPGRPRRSRPTSSCVGPRRTPPAMRRRPPRAPTMSRPGDGSPVRPPSMTRNGPAGHARPIRRPRGRVRRAPSSRSSRTCIGREVAQPEVRRGGGEPRPRAASSGDAPAWSATREERGQRRQPDRAPTRRARRRPPRRARGPRPRPPQWRRPRSRAGSSRPGRAADDRAPARDLEPVRLDASAARRRTRGHGGRSASRGRRRPSPG